MVVKNKTQHILERDGFITINRRDTLQHARRRYLNELASQGLVRASVIRSSDLITYELVRENTSNTEQFNSKGKLEKVTPFWKALRELLTK